MAQRNRVPMMKSASIFERLFSLAGKAALITGASGGIGQVLAGALAEAGAAVAVHGRDVGRVEESCRAIAQEGRSAVGLTADIESIDACRQLVADAHAALGRLDILINCAATNRRKPIEQVTGEDFGAIVDVNLRAPYFLSQAARRHMVVQGGGKIIHISSLNVQFGLDNVSLYGLTKGGLAQMTKAMAVEWAPDNIQVNSLTPGFILTPLTAALWADPKKARWFRSRIAMRRGGDPAELIGAVLLLAGPASSYITGQNLIVDGGFLAGGSWLRDGDVE
jgi:NAD(P)-dependent dehydrogenase (short-subunit alcohol dehydrogenase family)